MSTRTGIPPPATTPAQPPGRNAPVAAAPARLRQGEFDPGIVRRARLRLSNLRLDLRDSLAAAFRREGETGTAFNFVPVAIAGGIIAYFAAPAEPLGGALVVAAAVLALFALRQQVHGAGHFLAVAAALFLVGMAAGKLRVDSAFGPAPAREATVTVTGLVLSVDSNARGQPRYLIRPDTIVGLPEDQQPELVRLSATSNKTRHGPGDRVTGKARLMPISGPAFPGGHDFGFFARFDGIGATGFYFGAPGPAPPGAGASLADETRIRINRLRAAIGARIRAGLPGEPGDIAVALITGERSGIDEATNESLRRSGLAHVLAISGLHMALVAMTVIGAIRWLLSWFPAVALNHPVRKWAAATGLVAATAYLVISGGAVATQRAWIMIAVMLTAMLADRRAITMRNVAFAAIAILLVSPESLFEPGAQMSFAAVAALVAAYEAWTRWRGARLARRDPAPDSVLRRMFGALPGYFAGILFTSLVAGTATGLFSAWHFHRVAVMGLVSNMFAMPLVSLVVMPAALVSMLLMPFGYEGLLLWPVGAGIEAMVGISDRTNAWSGSGVTGLQPMAVLAAGSTGLLLLTALRSRLRLLGLAPLALIPFLAGAGPTPDVIASEDGRAIAVAGADGRLTLLYPRRNRFAADIWLRAWSHDAEGGRAMIPGECGRDFCAATLRDGSRLEVVYDPVRLKDACETADILVAPRLRWVNCRSRKPALVLKRGDFETRGSHAISIVAPAEANSAEPEDMPGNRADPAAVQPRYRTVTALRPSARPWSRPEPEPDPPPPWLRPETQTKAQTDLENSPGTGPEPETGQLPDQ